ncbi:peptidoglycan recognition family protein [Cellulosilyticum sp. ST5]|uniref:peptidoglycan recognition protein family protein n=1 Tax=Cellulosilyticum sp. ST5 TaxID=3055805 RepID=UPI0039778173
MAITIKEMLITPNKWSRPQTKIGTIKNIVVHWIGNAGSTAENNAKYFNSLKDGRGTYASSHYIIGNDGVVIRCVPENEVAYHASSANNYSIGIEVCHPDNTGKYTDAAYKALIELLVDLCGKYKLEPTQAIIRHYDVTGKDCPRYYVKNTEEWKRLKQDVEDAISKDEEIENAVKVLQEKGIISSPEVWIKGNYSVSSVRALVVKTANYIK